MAITRLGGANAITGTLPAANIDSTSLGNVDVGKVLQVVQGTSSTQFSQSSPTDGTIYYPSSNKLSATITPSSTSSKIIIKYVSTMRVNHGTTTDAGVALAVKETISGGLTTEIKPQANAYASGFYVSNTGSGSNYRLRLTEIVFRTPSTTSEITYEVGVFGYNSTLIYLNASSSRGEIVLMEIAG